MKHLYCIRCNKYKYVTAVGINILAGLAHCLSKIKRREYEFNKCIKEDSFGFFDLAQNGKSGADFFLEISEKNY